MHSHNGSASFRTVGDGRAVPHSQTAEESVLGAILIAPQTLRDVLPILEAHHFFSKRTQWIYKAIVSLDERREAIHEQTVADELERRSQLDQVGGRRYLTKITHNAPDLIGAMSEARIVKECWKRRQVLYLADKLAATTPDSAEGQRISAALADLMAQEEANTEEGLRQYLHAASALTHLSDPTWLIDSLLPDQGLTVLYGASGSGKSFLGLHLAALVAQDYAVLYVAAEGESGFKSRVAAWEKYHGQDSGDLHFYFNIAPLLDPQMERRFCSEVVDYVKPKLIILDTVAHCMLPGDENSTRDMMQFVRAAKRIQKRYGAAVLLIHHSNKEGIVERGNGSLRAAADSMIRLSLEDEVIAVECAKSKDIAPFPTHYMKLLPVELAQGKTTPVIIPAEKITRTADDTPSPRQRQVLETILDVFGSYGAPWTDLHDQLRVIPTGTLRRILAALRKVGFVTQDEARAPYRVTAAGCRAIGRDGCDLD